VEENGRHCYIDYQQQSLGRSSSTIVLIIHIQNKFLKIPSILA